MARVLGEGGQYQITPISRIGPIHRLFFIVMSDKSEIRRLQTSSLVVSIISLSPHTTNGEMLTEEITRLHQPVRIRPNV